MSIKWQPSISMKSPLVKMPSWSYTVHSDRKCNLMYVEEKAHNPRWALIISAPSSRHKCSLRLLKCDPKVGDSQVEHGSWMGLGPLQQQDMSHWITGHPHRHCTASGLNHVGCELMVGGRSVRINIYSSPDGHFICTLAGRRETRITILRYLVLMRFAEFALSLRESRRKTRL
ncbi:hypothetical protein BJX76DRAFT_213669 [Aspergillus varians]